MADPRFFINRGPFQLAELAELTGASLSESADPEQLMEDVAPLDEAEAGHVSFLDNPKYAPLFATTRAGACFVHPKQAANAPAGTALLITEKPYLAYALAATLFYPAEITTGISPHAHLHDTAEIGTGTQIAAGAVIERGVVIGENCRIGANVTISHALIGKRVIIHPGACIGQDGFGFARGEMGAVKVPQLGRVRIEDDVEIGANTTIDRGAGPDTVIGMGAKIDNLVQIGHNVRIGRFATVVSQAGISGSTEVGDGAVLAGQVGVAGHLKIGQGAVLAARSGVTKNVPDGESYGGFPAIPIMQWRRQMAALARLTRKKDASDD